MSKKPSEQIPSADEFLFGNGAQLEDYFLDCIHVDNALCMIGKDGREYYIHISHEDLHKNVVARLIELGARIRNR